MGDIHFPYNTPHQLPVSPLRLRSSPLLLLSSVPSLLPLLKEAMRMSCNGCRVLRKGCSEDCSIRPCLQWIKSPDHQANATVFLAKFYGRAGLMNLINSGPDHLRPAIFRSLLYEACGRIVNPIYGSVGLLWSGNWQMCQAAVEAVLKGAPIVQVPSEEAATSPVPPLKAYDIRHVSKCDGGGGQDLHKVARPIRTRFKRPGSVEHKARPGNILAAASSEATDPIDVADSAAPFCNLRWRRCYPEDYHREQSHDSSATHESDPHENGHSGGSGGSESSNHAGQSSNGDERVVELDLTLGLEPMTLHARSNTGSPREMPQRCDAAVEGWGTSVELALDLPA